MSDTATMHIDGASRGNPGKAAYAIVLARPGLPVVEEADTIGTASNNVAEYTALVEGLTLAHELGVKKLQIFSDSELMVKQMNGEYKVKNEDLRGLYEEACRLRKQFDKVTITHVRREQNRRADAIGNDALDGKPRKRGASEEVEREGSRSEEKKTVAPSVSSRPTPRAPLPRPPRSNVDDSAVRADAVQCLADAARHWAASGVAGLPPEAVWDQLWSLLDEAGVLKKKK
jgi:ribonuclease HI